MKRPSANMLRLARALDPASAVPGPGWHDRTQAALGEAVALASSNRPGDHMAAALLMSFTGKVAR